jgi:hypothetical protein
MQISFVRTHSAPDRVYVVRTNGTEVSWSFPTFGNYIPHDLVHLVVEAFFGLKSGFWGRVDAGIDVARINEDANRKGGPNKYAAFGLNQEELLLSEALAATRWGDSTLSDETIAAELLRNNPALAPLGTDRVVAVRDKLDELCRLWITLVPKGTIKSRFDSKDPTKSVIPVEEH